MSHGHSHGGGCSCSAERSDGPERGLEYGLYQKIDLEKLQCLNESKEGSGKTVFRAWEERGDRSREHMPEKTIVCMDTFVKLEGSFQAEQIRAPKPYVESDDDEELLFNIPFTGNVKLKGIIIIGEDSNAHPSEMRL
ncbi:hypothetical protein AB205_0037220 [Aquarana catesbeiana]|uniref:PITH domain-containing protein n=1 Tax=Aquarana catesbeiana TaxID=8400 RepID=A0A2G9RRJ2_AQUCT|nr:hypothetical protein AB205_0037220 [Aquarana catesbeiana]